jgi:hypothetical protein
VGNLMGSINSLQAMLDRTTKVNKKISRQAALKPHWFYLAVLIYLLVFLAMRLTNLTEFPLNVDERRHIIRAQITVAEGDIFIGLRESLKQLYIWLLALMLPFMRDHILAARLVTVLTGVGTAAVCYKLGQSLYDSRRIGMLAALFYLIIPMALFYDRLAYTDPLLTMLMGISILLSFQLWRIPTIKWAIALGVVFGLAALTKVYAALYYPAPVLVWFFLYRNNGIRHPLKLLAIVYGTAFMLWLPIFIVGFSIFQEDHTQKLITDLPTASWQQVVASNTAATVDWLGGYLTLPFAVLFLVSLCLIFIEKDRPGWVLATLLAIHTISFILLLRFGAARYLLPIIVPVSVISAWGVNQLVQQSAWVVERVTARRLLSAGGLWVVMVTVLLLLGLPALRFDYLIVTDLPRAPLPSEDRSIFVEGRFSGYGLKESADLVAALAGQFPELIVLKGTNLMDTIFSLDVIGMSVYLQDLDNITYEEVGTIDEQTIQRLDRYAQRAPTLTLGTFDRDGEPLPMFGSIINHPRAWRVATFTKPGQRHKVELYQWLLWPDLAVRWLQQAGDPDPHIALFPTDDLVTADGGVFLSWPETANMPGGIGSDLRQTQAEYVLLDANMVDSQPALFAPFVTVEGAALRFSQPPPDWYLAFAYPELACQWCLFYVRPPTMASQAR